MKPAGFNAIPTLGRRRHAAAFVDGTRGKRMADPEYFRRKARECADLATNAADERDVRLLRAMEREFRQKAEAAEAESGVDRARSSAGTGASSGRVSG